MPSAVCRSPLHGCRRRWRAGLLTVAMLASPGMGNALQIENEAPSARPPQATVPAPAASAPGADTSPAVLAELARLRATASGAPRNGGRRASAGAAWLLGLAALHGVGGPVDPVVARTWFLRAQQLGEPLAAAGLGWCAIDGCGGAPDPAQAQRWIAALRRLDPGRALYLEWLLQTHLAALQPPPPPAAPGVAPEGLQPRGPPASPVHRLLEAAAGAGSVHARLELALEQAAAGRDTEALARMRALAPRSPAAAANVELLVRRVASAAARAGMPGSDAFARAQRAHRGEGQPANFAEAIRLYRLAQQQGSKPASRMLALIFSRPAPGGGVDIAWMQQLARVDVTKELPTVEKGVPRGLLRREPTALSDLVPARWLTEPRSPAHR